MPRSKNSSGEYRPKYKNKAHFSLVSISVYPRSRRGAERIRQGEGRWSRPPKTALERSYLTENSSSENRMLRPKRRKLLTESLKKRMICQDKRGFISWDTGEIIGIFQVRHEGNLKKFIIVDGGILNPRPRKPMGCRRRNLSSGALLIVRLTTCKRLTNSLPKRNLTT